MSAVCVLTPIVIAAWPVFADAVAAAAAALGYSIVSGVAEAGEAGQNEKQTTKVQLDIAQSELVTDRLGRDQQITVRAEGVTVTFSRDARGRATLCVTGTGQTEDVLRALGEQLAKRVIQQYVYQRLIEEIRLRQFVLVEEYVDDNNAIHLKVRHWDQ
jgi:hypothetical protein